MKKKVLFALALVGIAALPLAGCGGNGDTKAEGKAEAGTYYGLDKVESVYGVSAVTAAKLLAATEQDAGIVSAAAVTDEAEKFNRYFNMLDSFLDKAQTTTVVESNGSADEAVADYALKLTVTGRGIEGEEVSHTVYFTETEGRTVQDSYRDEDETVTVERTEYALSGVVPMTAEDGTAVYYRMEGTRTESLVTEEEGRDRETSRVNKLELRAYAEDERNYVKIEHTQTAEEEEGETETESLYVYSVYEGGALVETTQVKFEEETERGGTEAEYEVRFLSGGSRGRYEIERETGRNGSVEIVVEYSIDGANGRFRIAKNADGSYRYRYNNSEFDRDFEDFDD